MLLIIINPNSSWCISAWCYVNKRIWKYLIFTTPWGRNHYYSCSQQVRLREVKSLAPDGPAIKGLSGLSHPIDGPHGPWSTKCSTFSTVWSTLHVLTSSLDQNYKQPKPRLCNWRSPAPFLSSPCGLLIPKRLAWGLLCSARPSTPFSSELCTSRGSCICSFSLVRSYAVM